MADIVGKRKWILIAVAVYCAIAVLFIGIFGLRRGIEFSSGSILTIKFEQEVSQADLKQALDELGFQNAIIQRTSGGDFIIRVQTLSSDVKTNLESILEGKFGKLTEVEFSSISPMIAGETTRNTAIAVVVATIGILLYIAWAFRHMPNPLLFGASAVIALVHDTVITLAFFAFMGRFFNWEINLMFVTGILALVGYSVNNTVVVFDRIRENLTRGVSKDFKSLVNSSLLETLGRCLNTVITTQITILAIMLFVGASVQNFAVALLVGLVAGTFSSTFIAPLLLVAWEKSGEVKSEA